VWLVRNPPLNTIGVVGAEEYGKDREPHSSFPGFPLAFSPARGFVANLSRDSA
jgi:hypothetical protein